jgi:eukaryotic-like serine/threonine-protein kinase
MTSFATRFRPFPSSDAAAGSDDDASAPTMDASMTPVVPTMDESAERARVATMQDASRPAIVDPAMHNAERDGARYDVKSVLGRGGMGEVRLCHDTRIGRDVAIKVAHASRDRDDAIRARFLRESRVQGQLEHPAIVPVYDLEVFDDGSAYFAMKRVKGVTLAHILAGLARSDDDVVRRFPTRKLLAAFNSVCLAVDFAHTKGVVHRDIKPGNIMLGDFGEVYLLDWGLAKVLHVQDDAAPVESTARVSDQGATLVGSVLGTPGYMAPEQIDASIGAISPAADVYALGAVLFEILALTKYVDAQDYMEATIATLQGVERRPSRCARTAPAVAAHIAPALDALCERALARNPADRLESARALHDAIDAHLSGEHDLERRRALSAAQLDAAARHSSDTDAGRAAALKELGSALALDPENADARRSLVRLLTTSPTHIPPEVQQRIEDDRNARVRAVARMRAISGVAFIPFLLAAIFFFGIVDRLAFGLIVSGLVVAAAVSMWLARSKSPSRAAQIVAHIAFMLVSLSAARVAGPLIIVPGLLVGYAVELQMHPHRNVRRAVLVLCCATMALAFLLDVVALAPSYAIVDGRVLLQSHMLARLDEPALWFIAAAAVMSIITPSVFVTHVRDELTAAEAKLHLQTWQLAQIVPQEARK